MPVILHEHRGNGIQWAVWRMEETIDELLLLSMNYEQRVHELSLITSPKRKVEFLATRLLLEYLLKKEAGVIYHENGKPYLSDHSFQISFSHTKGFAAVAIHPEISIGIDIEAVSSKIEKVKERVFSEKELLTIDRSLEQLHLLLHWSAKESVYKALGVEGVDFKLKLEVAPFELKSVGHFTLQEKVSTQEREYQILYSTTEDYVLTVAF